MNDVRTDAATHARTKSLLRLFGALNLTFSALGGWLMTSTLTRFLDHPGRSQVSGPYFVPSFYAMSTVNALFLVGLALCGVSLLRLQSRAFAMSNVLFISELIYLATLPATSFLSWSYGGNLGRGISAASGIGNVGIGPHILLGYPIIALVALNLLRRRKLPPQHPEV